MPVQTVYPCAELTSGRDCRNLRSLQWAAVIIGKPRLRNGRFFFGARKSSAFGVALAVRGNQTVAVADARCDRLKFHD